MFISSDSYHQNMLLESLNIPLTSTEFNFGNKLFCYLRASDSCHENEKVVRITFTEYSYKF